MKNTTVYITKSDDNKYYNLIVSGQVFQRFYITKNISYIYIKNLLKLDYIFIK